MIFQRKTSNAKKTTFKGIKFDSILEKNRYLILRDYEKKGIIKDLSLQVPFEIIKTQEKGLNRIPSLTKKHKVRKTTYNADFTYTIVKTGQKIINDVKGRTMEVYKLKLKLIIHHYCTNNQWLFLETYKDNMIEL